mgnify:CR=1 FL=1
MQIGEKIKIIRENKKMLTHAMCFISLIMTNLQKRGNWQKTPVSTPRALPLILTPSLAVRAGKQSLKNFGFQPIQCLGLVS